MSAEHELARLILSLEKRIEQVDRRLNNVVREARVAAVKIEDGKEPLVKVEAHGLPTAWSPWMDRAGTGRAWSPPVEGERGLFFSPSGEPGQGVFLRGGYSDAFKAPSSDPDAEVFVIGDLTVTRHKDHYQAKLADDIKVDITKDYVRGVKGDARFVAAGDQAKIRKGEAWVVVNDGVFVSHPPVVAPDNQPEL